MRNKDTTQYWIVWLVLLICGFFTYRKLHQENQELKRNIVTLQEDLALVQSRISSTIDSVEFDLEGDHLQRSFKRLGSKNILEQYQAGLTVKQYGRKAVPGLLELVRTGESRARKVALILLGDLKHPSSFPALRDIAKSHPDEKTNAGALWILAKSRDDKSLSIFLQKINDESEGVRAASIVGLRRLGAVQHLPIVMSRFDKEHKMVYKEVCKTVRSFSHTNPELFAEKMKGIPPKQRFEICKLLAADSSVSSSMILRKALSDDDHRVALAAANILGKRGDKAALDTAKRLSKEVTSEELQGIANDLLKKIK